MKDLSSAIAESLITDRSFLFIEWGDKTGTISVINRGKVNSLTIPDADIWTPFISEFFHNVSKKDQKIDTYPESVDSLNVRRPDLN